MALPLSLSARPRAQFETARTPAPRTRVSSRERSRRAVVFLTLVVYLLAIFEGVLRKWLFPGLGQYLFFVRDPFVLLAYVIATKDHLWPRKSLPLRLGLIAGVLGGLVALLQLALAGFAQTDVLLAAYGWRNYFFYLPLAFLAGAQFRRADVFRLLKITLLLAAPLALLVFLQFRAPANAPINVGNAADSLSQFRGLGLDPDHTRPMGTFTSVSGEAMFLATAFAALLGVLLIPAKRRPIGGVTLLIGAIGIFSALAFSGSRYAFLHCGLAVLGAMALGLIARGSSLRWRALILPATVVTFALVLYPIVFPAGFASISNRFSTADEFEQQQFGGGGVFKRALSGMTAFVPLVKDVPALGYGLGYGGNASTLLGTTINGVSPLELAESDWSRHIVDLGPLFGCMFIVFRIWLTCWLLQRVLRHTRRSSDPLALLLFSFLLPELLFGQVTGHGTVNVYTWLFVGLCLASMRSARRRRGAPARAAGFAHADRSGHITAPVRRNQPGAFTVVNRIATLQK